MSLQSLHGQTQLRLAVHHASHVGECRRAIQSLAEAVDFDETSAGRAAIVAVELATNLLRHAEHGELFIQTIVSGEDVQLELLSIDRGPGMPNVAECLRDGYSTAGTVGNGLGAISRLSETFDVFSADARGTVVLSRVAKLKPLQSRAQKAFAGAWSIGAMNVAFSGEKHSGDCWAAALDGSTFALTVVDGLGHGPLACAAAHKAVQAFKEKPLSPPSESIRRMHQSLTGTRGAAAACCLFNPVSQTIQYCGIGNISGSVVSPQCSRGMPSHNGTLGMLPLRTREFEFPWAPGSLLIMHSDGVSARHALNSYERLINRHPGVIAAVLYRDYGRGRDDASIVVTRCPS